MQVENRNDKLKQKLDALTEVPEAFHFNPPAVWGRLEAQLQNNSKNRNRSVSLYSAASVLFMIVSFLVYRHLSMQETIASPVEANKSIESKKNNLLPQLKSKSLSPVSKYIEKKPAVKLKSAQQLMRVTTPVVRTTALAPELITYPVEKNFQHESIGFKEKDEHEEISIAIVPVVSKMRFKIAHINEVNRNPVPDDFAMQAEKLNYSLSLRKHITFSNTDEKEQTPAYSLRKPKNFFSLINSQ